MWSPSCGPCGVTSSPTHPWITASWSAFVLGSFSNFKMSLRKAFFLKKTTRNDIEFAVGPFRSQQVALGWPYLLSRHIRTGTVSAFSCQNNVVESYDRSRSLSIFLKQFNSMLSTNTSIFVRHKQHTNSYRQQLLNLHVLLGFFGFSLALGTSAFKVSSSSFPISTSARDSPTGTMSSPIGATSRLRVFVGLASDFGSTVHEKRHT